MKLSTITWFCLAAAFMTGAGDVLSTAMGLKLGATEINPVMVMLHSFYGVIYGTVVFKMLIASLLIWDGRKGGEEQIRKYALFMAIMQGGAVAWNITRLAVYSGVQLF